ncbi:MAG: ATP-dependent DNA ligase [Verrucomicrobiota bacterium]
MPLLPVQPRHGSAWLPELDLWLDPHRAQDFAFISHAHADHFAPSRRCLATPVTAAFLRTRYGKKLTIMERAFGEVFSWEGHRLSLHPAGHTFGSAMLRVEREADGVSFLYTGDFKMRPSLTAETAQPPPADSLLMETTYGLPHFQFPDSQAIRPAIQHFCEDALSQGEVPVLLGYSLGKAQELMAIVAEAELPMLVHPAIEKISRDYEAQGRSLGRYAPLKKESDLAGQVLLTPPNTVRSTLIRRIPHRRLAMASGWGLQAGASFRYQVDEVFVLSDHADHSELHACIKAVQPKLILTTHGYAREFAAELRQAGREAWTLRGQDQIELPLSLEQEAGPALPSDTAIPPSEWGELCQAAEAAGRASGRLQKISLLASYLARLQDQAESLARATRFLAGRATADRDSQKRLQVGSALVRAALLAHTGLPLARYQAISRSQNDLGRTTFLLLQQGRSEARPWSLRDVDEWISQIGKATTQQAKLRLLRQAFAQLPASQGSLLVRLLTGDLRLGLKQGLVEESLAKAFDQPLAAIREAILLTGDLGETANLAAGGGLASAQHRPFVPLQPMLASPEKDAESLFQRLAAGTPIRKIWLEPKFDGIRLQLHKVGERVELYSRDTRTLTEEFPDLVQPVTTHPGDFLLDGELIAYDGDRKLTFFDLQKRLGRRQEPDLFGAQEIPVRFLAFDCLWAEGKSLLQQPLQARRACLESLRLKEPLEIVPLCQAASPEEIEVAFLQAKREGHEGLIAKDPASRWLASRRGKHWLKLKKAMPTLDCVVVKAQQGHGKRSHVLSDYTFALQDEQDASLKVLGKAYSGLTDEEIEELTEHFERTTLSQRGRVRTVEPQVVLEIAFDSIQPSQRHNSGLSLRFPRIHAWRRDKVPTEIDSLATARKLAGLPG